MAQCFKSAVPYRKMSKPGKKKLPEMQRFKFSAHKNPQKNIYKNFYLLVKLEF